MPSIFQTILLEYEYILFYFICSMPIFETDFIDKQKHQALQHKHSVFHHKHHQVDEIVQRKINKAARDL